MSLVPPAYRFYGPKAVREAKNAGALIDAYHWLNVATKYPEHSKAQLSALHNALTAEHEAFNTGHQS